MSEPTYTPFRFTLPASSLPPEVFDALAQFPTTLEAAMLPDGEKAGVLAQIWHPSGGVCLITGALVPAPYARAISAILLAAKAGEPVPAPADAGDLAALDVAKLQQQHAELADVLRWLYDLQNGCPLPKYEADWERTMERAGAILAAVEVNEAVKALNAPAEAPE